MRKGEDEVKYNLSCRRSVMALLYATVSHAKYGS